MKELHLNTLQRASQKVKAVMAASIPSAFGLSGCEAGFCSGLLVIKCPCSRRQVRRQCSQLQSISQ